MRQRVVSQAPTTGCAAFCDLTGTSGLRYIRVQYGFCCSKLLYKYAYFQEVDRRDTHSDTDPALVPCAVLLLLPLLHTPASASAVLLLILMLPLLRVQHHQWYGY